MQQLQTTLLGASVPQAARHTLLPDKVMLYIASRPTSAISDHLRFLHDKNRVIPVLVAMMSAENRNADEQAAWVLSHLAKQHHATITEAGALRQLLELVQISDMACASNTLVALLSCSDEHTWLQRLKQGRFPFCYRC